MENTSSGTYPSEAIFDTVRPRGEGQLVLVLAMSLLSFPWCETPLTSYGAPPILPFKTGCIQDGMGEIAGLYGSV